MGSRKAISRPLLSAVERLVPALQRRGLVRTEYSFDHFRDDLLEYWVRWFNHS